MATLNNWWRCSPSIRPPEGIIVGIDSSDVVPDNWSSYTVADGLFLKGTDSDTTVGTTRAATSLSLTVGTAGAHSDSANEKVKCGNNSGTSYSPSKDFDSKGAHATHIVPVNYTPIKNNIVLIQAGASARFESSLLMFSTGAQEKHTQLSIFDDTNGLLCTGSITGTIAATKSTGTTSSASDYHRHRKDVNYNGLAIDKNVYTTGGDYAGGTHTHTGGTPTVTPAHKKAMLRLWKIVGASEMEGLIGMWVGTGIPDKWELVTETVNNYISFTRSGSGESSGNNTVTISGTTGTKTHSHSFSGLITEDAIFTLIPHSDSLAHNHIYSGTKGYEPARLHVKFIRYKG